MGILDIFKDRKREIDWSKYSPEVKAKFEEELAKKKLSLELQSRQRELESAYAPKPQDKKIGIGGKMKIYRLRNLEKRRIRIQEIKLKGAEIKARDELRKLQLQANRPLISSSFKPIKPVQVKKDG